MGWFGGTKESKCPRCGAAVPFVISGGGGQDDLMRRSKVNVGNNGRNPLCSNCMRAAHVSTARTSPPPPPPTAQPTPWNSPPPSPPPLSMRTPATIAPTREGSSYADPEFEEGFQQAKRIAAFLGKDINDDKVEQLKARLREQGVEGQLGKQLGKTVRGCVWTIFLIITFFVVIGWLAGSEETALPTPETIEAPQPS